MSGVRNPDWHLGHAGRWSVVGGQLTLFALRDYRGRVPGCDFSQCVSTGQRGEFQVFFREEDIARQLEELPEILSRPGWVDEFCRAASAAERRLRHFAARTRWSARTPDAELGRLNDRLNRLWVDVYAYYQVSSSHFSQDVVRSTCARYAGSAFERRDVVQCLLTPDVRSLDFHREQEDWLRLCTLWVDGAPGADIQRRLREHSERYLHLTFKTSGASFTPEALLARLEQVRREDVEHLRASLHRSSWLSATADAVAAACAERIGLPPDVLAHCRAVARLSVLRLSQRESRQYSFTRMGLLLEEIFDRIERRSGQPLSRELRRHLSAEEIDAFLYAGTLPDLGEVAQRCAHSLLELVDGTVRVWSGDRARARRQELGIPSDVPAPHPKLVGTAVSGSRAAVGHAVVMRKDQADEAAGLDPARVAGRVLVTEMIQPYMVPLCAEAAAIVTEEGGLASHAAVIARELRIPCVVGVQGATRALQSGDGLFVSVRSGRIRVLSPDRMARIEARRSRPAPPPVEAAPARAEEGDGGARPHVVPLSEAAGCGVALVGGKAAALGAIHHLTPSGFVLTTAATRGLFHAGEGDGTRLRDVLRTPLASLGAARVAVRSSHPYEDGTGRSYAGLFASVLDVPSRSTDDCLAAVRQVIGSAADHDPLRYGGRALAAPAVVIQEMIAPRLSGVVLTSVRRRGEAWIVLEYVPGGLDKLMAGRVRPIRSAARRSGSAQIGSEALLPPVPGGMVPDSTLDELLGVALELERRNGCPQEVEWGIDAGGRLWLFQTRPITGYS